MFDLLTQIDYPMWVIVLGVSIVGIGIIAQSSLYAKAQQPAISAIVPVWNVFTFLKLVGRPAWHSIYLLVPGIVMMVFFGLYYDQFFEALRVFVEEDSLPSIASLEIPLIAFGASGLALFVFMAKVWVEIAQSFGKNKTSDYISVIVFNGLYLVNLGLSHNVHYLAPAYKYNKEGLEIPKKIKKKKRRVPARMN